MGREFGTSAALGVSRVGGWIIGGPVLMSDRGAAVTETAFRSTPAGDGVATNSIVGKEAPSRWRSERTGCVDSGCSAGGGDSAVISPEGEGGTAAGGAMRVGAMREPDRRWEDQRCLTLGRGSLGRH